MAPRRHAADLAAALLQELEEQQQDVLRRLDDLNQRIETVIREFRPEEPTLVGPEGLAPREGWRTPRAA